jgi:K+-transporting ATPase ATPase C chain
MLVNLRRSFLLSLLFLLLLGLVYPLIGTGISQVFFKHQADGSFTANGSTLIGQTWNGPKWFQGRPDGTVLTTGPGGVVVSGTNQSPPLSKALAASVVKQSAILRKEGITPTNDLVTTSGSLLDPDISPDGAYAQVDSVAAANHLSVAQVTALVKSHIHGDQLGFLGAPYVNILELNDALAKLG